MHIHIHIFIYIYVYIYIYKYTLSDIRLIVTHAWETYINIHIYIYEYIYIYMNMDKHTYIPYQTKPNHTIHYITYIHICTYIYIPIYICIYIYMYTYNYIVIYIYTDTCIFTTQLHLPRLPFAVLPEQLIHQLGAPLDATQQALAQGQITHAHRAKSATSKIWSARCGWKWRFSWAFMWLLHICWSWATQPQIAGSSRDM